MESIKIANLNKNYGNKKALDNISLNIRGSFGLLGPNGAGKTTLMRILATLTNQDQGQVFYKEFNWKQKQEIKRLIGYLPQQLSMYKKLTVTEVLDHFAFLKGNTEKKSRRSEVQEILRLVNLESQHKTKIKNLSGGMLRRVGIGQALLGNPEILIVDEPTSGLDVEERTRFRNLLRKIAKDKTIIISSHIVEDLETTCDNIAILSKGKVITTGSREEIIAIAKGRVFEKRISMSELDNFNEEQIISTKQVGSQYMVRFFCDNLNEPLVPEEPTLEDGYLYKMRFDKE